MNKMENNNKTEGKLTFGGYSIGNLILAVIIAPTISFFFAYVGGMLLNWVVGANVIQALNTLFNTTRFTRDIIPVTCAILGVIKTYVIPHNKGVEKEGVHSMLDRMSQKLWTLCEEELPKKDGDYSVTVRILSEESSNYITSFAKFNADTNEWSGCFCSGDIVAWRQAIKMDPYQPKK